MRLLFFMLLLPWTAFAQFEYSRQGLISFTGKARSTLELNGAFYQTTTPLPLALFRSQREGGQDICVDTNSLAFDPMLKELGFFRGEGPVLCFRGVSGDGSIRTATLRSARRHRFCQGLDLFEAELLVENRGTLSFTDCGDSLCNVELTWERRLILPKRRGHEVTLCSLLSLQSDHVDHLSIQVSAAKLRPR